MLTRKVIDGRAFAFVSEEEPCNEKCFTQNVFLSYSLILDRCEENNNGWKELHSKPFEHGTGFFTERNKQYRYCR
jgi:hypothetical protein